MVSCVALGVAGSAAVALPATGRAVRLLVLGDSLSAEYGLARGTGWVALMEARLVRDKIAATVVNASISGDTTSGGRARIGALLSQHRPTHVVIELGSNDALRGLPLKSSQDNLVAIAQAAKAAGAKVLVVGMQVPPNYGGAYTRDFYAMFGEVARSQGAALVPFLLAGIADDPDPVRWFQADRLHPNATAHPRILDNVWPVLKPWLKA
ncbi:arylesterase [uncultured Sphaerotilus sp.]|uniref:arylesterase n=1 Tax=uncultured Sphaerotilus sp. TaxID=474984 RepID=UPI0030CA508B